MADRPRSGAGYPEHQAPGLEVVGRVSTDGANPRVALLPVTQTIFTWNSKAPSCEHLWQIGSQVYESYATSVAPIAFPPIEDSSPTSSIMHLRIIPASTAGGRAFLLDLGQSIEVVAEQITVELVAPQGSSTITARARPSPSTGLLFCSKVGLRMVRLEESRSVSTGLFTQTWYCRAGTAVDVQVPPAARRLTLYGENAISPVMRWFRGTVFALGLVDWDPLRPRQEIDVPSASMLRIESAASDRTFTFVWTIAP